LYNGLIFIGQIKQTVEKAFWDVVRDQLKTGDDDMMIPMIREIREQILNFLAPNSGTRERIKGQIDMELIEQQYVAGCLDYKVLFKNIKSKDAVFRSAGTSVQNLALYKIFIRRASYHFKIYACNSEHSISSIIEQKYL